MKKIIFLLLFLITFSAHSQCVIDGTTVTGITKAKTMKACDAVVQSLSNGIVKSSGDSLKTAVSGTDYIAPGTGYAFTAWSSSVPYVSGNVSYSGGHVWAATGSSTNEIPGSGLNWTLLTTNTAAYNATTWNGSIMSPTQDAVRDKFEGLGSTYLPLAGGTMSGDINLGGNDISNTLTVTSGKYTANTTIDDGTQGAVYLTRILDGNGANGHGVKDKTDFRDGGQSYCSFDCDIKINSGTSENFDHGIGFQSRISHETEGTTNDLYAFGDFVTVIDGTVNNLYTGLSAPSITNGTGALVNNRFGYRIKDIQGGGDCANNYGLYIDFLDGGYNDNKGIYLDGQIDTYFGTGNHGFGSTSYGSGVGIFSLGNATTQPTAEAPAGAFLWAYQKQLKTNSSIVIKDTSKFYYLGDSSVNSSWRLRIQNADLVTEKRISGTWTKRDKVIHGTYSTTGVATTTFTVTIGETMANATYFPSITPSNALSCAVFYVNNKTTTTFDVVYLAGLTGAVAFEWGITK